MAAYLGKRPLYKRLKHCALAMSLSYLPGWEEPVASDHELKLIRDNFTIKFPERGRIVDPVPDFSALHERHCAKWDVLFISASHLHQGR